MPALVARVAVYSDEQLYGLLMGLAFAACAQMREARANGRPIPELYKTKIRYQREAPGKENWQLPTQTLSRLAGDCEDLAAGYRVPELWLAGETGAMVFLKRVNTNLRHIQVMRADGSIEDPSALLGMPAKPQPPPKPPMITRRLAAAGVYR